MRSKHGYNQTQTILRVSKNFNAQWVLNKVDKLIYSNGF